MKGMIYSWLILRRF